MTQKTKTDAELIAEAEAACVYLYVAEEEEILVAAESKVSAVCARLAALSKSEAELAEIAEEMQSLISLLEKHYEGRGSGSVIDNMINRIHINYAAWKQRKETGDAE